MTKSLLGSIAEDKEPAKTKDILDVGLAVFHLRVLQSLMAVDETLSPLFSTPTPNGPVNLSLRNSRVVSDAVLNILGLSLTSSKTSRPSVLPMTTFTGVIGGLHAYLDVSVFHSMSQMNKSSRATRKFQIGLKESRTVSTLTRLHVDLGDIDSRFFGHGSSEMIVATLDNLLRMAQDIRLDLVRRQARFKAARQRQIWDVLQYGKTIRADDPLAQSQPSFLIQSGRPLNIRRNPSWKLFMYIRHCLRWIVFSQRQVLSRLPSSKDITFELPSQDAVVDVLLDRLNDWGTETTKEEIATLSFLRYCGFEEGILPNPDTHKTMPSMSLRTGLISFGLSDSALDHHSGLDNTFSLGPLHVNYCRRLPKTTMTPRKIGNIATNAFFPQLETKNTLHHVLSAVVATIDLTIFPSFILFLQQLLPLHGKYFQYRSSKPGTNPPTAPIIRTEGMDDYWEVFVDINRGSLQAAVEGMALEVGVSRLRLTTSLLKGVALQVRPRPITSINGFLGFSESFMQVRQALDETNPFVGQERDILARLSLRGLILDLTYHSEGDSPPVVHGLISMDGALASVPRSAFLTYKLVEEWRVQYLP